MFRRSAMGHFALVITTCLTLAPTAGWAGDGPSPKEREGASDRPGLMMEGYLEAAYTHSFAHPHNRVIAQRAFDNRHATFAVSNAVLGLSLEGGPVYGRVAFQLGLTPTTYFQAEPRFPAEGGAGPLDAEYWRHLQEAYGGFEMPGLPALTFDAGLFLSQIGIEPIAIKDAWNWSRSNLFFGLPFYHTGARAHYQLPGGLKATAAVYNGWNSVVDNNTNKSISFRLERKSAALEAAVLYFGGVERPNDSPRVQPWRHLFDAWVRGAVLSRLELALHANAGFEEVPEGTLDWYAGSLLARFSPLPQVSLASRTDLFIEHAPRSASGRVAIFWAAERLTSQTLTLSWWPHGRLRCLLEHRYDNASGSLFYRGASDTPNARHQHTVTAGLVLVL